MQRIVGVEVVEREQWSKVVWVKSAEHGGRCELKAIVTMLMLVMLMHTVLMFMDYGNRR